jgi:hypothetical protein
LLHDHNGPTAPAFAYYLPVYSSGFVPNLLADRERLLQGFVVSKFDLKDFIRTALQGVPLDIDFQLTDPLLLQPDGITQGVVLYDHGKHHRDSATHKGHTQASQRLARTDQFFLGNRYLDLSVASTPAFEVLIDDQTPRLMALAGAVCSAALGAGVFYNATANVVTVCDVSLTNGPGMITVNSLDVVPGKTITITGISMQVGRA